MSGHAYNAPPVRSLAFAGKGTPLNINPQWEVHPAQVKAWLDAHEDLPLLDVRQPKEWSAGHIDAAKLIPLDQLETQIPAINNYADRRIVIHCHLGKRSLVATALLRSKGFRNVHSMAGGIEAWNLLLTGKLQR